MTNDEHIVEADEDYDGKWAVYECSCPTCRHHWVSVAPYGFPPMRCHRCERLGVSIGPGKSKPIPH